MHRCRVETFPQETQEVRVKKKSSPSKQLSMRFGKCTAVHKEHKENIQLKS